MEAEAKETGKFKGGFFKKKEAWKRQKKEGALHIDIGHVDSSKRPLEYAVHHAAQHGQKKKLKNALKELLASVKTDDSIESIKKREEELSKEKTGLVDCRNDAGQTALFIAAYHGKVDCMTVLLQHGANPNTRCDQNQTPAHACCFHGTVPGLCQLLENGGEMRYMDDKGHTPREYAYQHPDRRVRKDLLEYIEKTRCFCITNTGRDLLLERQSDAYLERTTGSAGSVHKLFQGQSESGSSVGPSRMGFESLYNYVGWDETEPSMGFGTVYVGKQQGIISNIPLVPDTVLEHDKYGRTFENGAYMVMESMKWDKSKVTVKRLHHKPLDSYGVIDLLVEESNMASHLRHPNILLLMGICQVHNLDQITLLFERVKYGSLYVFLHKKSKRLSAAGIRKIMLQMADALVYIHSRGIVHCSLSSHAIQLVCPNIAKLSNFEYAINYSDAHDANLEQFKALKHNSHPNAVVNWMAPELLSNTGGYIPCEESDIYSYCAVMWEAQKGEIPWAGLDADHIMEKILSNEERLSLEGCPENLYDLLDTGLSTAPSNRKLNFKEMRDHLYSLTTSV